MNYNTNQVKIGVGKLADMMGCSSSTISRSIKLLVDAGVLTKVIGQRANTYTVVMEEGKGMTSDDWDDFETLGEDLDKAEEKAAPAKGGRLKRLLHHFSTGMEILEPMAIQAPVNSKAMFKHFKEMMDVHGITEAQIHEMLDLFILDLQMGRIHRKSIPAWQAFLAHREELFKRVDNTVNEGEDLVFINGGV